jgi:hypothetical protein
MNGDGPLPSLDPSADRVSYPPVLHGLEFRSKSAPEQCAVVVRRGTVDCSEHREAAGVGKRRTVKNDV